MLTQNQCIIGADHCAINELKNESEAKQQTKKDDDQTNTEKKKDEQQKVDNKQDALKLLKDLQIIENRLKDSLNSNKIKETKKVIKDW